jgi:hypothetical protein
LWTKRNIFLHDKLHHVLSPTNILFGFFRNIFFFKSILRVFFRFTKNIQKEVQMVIPCNPLEFLLHFFCTTKRWRLLTDNPKFMNVHTRNTILFVFLFFFIFTLWDLRASWKVKNDKRLQWTGNIHFSFFYPLWYYFLIIQFFRIFLSRQ